ncbi:polysaccharide deacetylase family protein [Candidatus Poribacteria bacterium]
MMKVIAVYTDTQFSSPIMYTFDLMLSVLGVEYRVIPYSETALGGIDSGDLLISYGHRRVDPVADYQIHIYQSRLFSGDYKTSSSMPHLPLKHWNGLPVIYEGNGDMGDLVAQSGNLVETNIDVIASSFFMVSRYEEIILDVEDKHGRFPAKASIAHKEDFLSRPIVNEYIDLLCRWIQNLRPDFQRKKLWADRDFAVSLTHDVDNIRKYRWWCPPLNSLARTAKRGQLGKTLHYVWDWLLSSSGGRTDPYWNFDKIVALEHEYGFRSSFYFLAGGDTKYDRRYSINNPKIIALIEKLEDMGHEVGLHGSYSSSSDYEKFMSEKRKLDQVVSSKQYGGRYHYLRWTAPDTWRILEGSGILYDTTLGYAEHAGFRCGICLPFRPFDVLEDRMMDLWEIPLIAMEQGLFGYQNLSPDEVSEEIQRLIDVNERHGGVFVTLWHNDCFYRLDNPDALQLYQRMLDYINSKNALCGTVRDALSIWLKAVEPDDTHLLIQQCNKGCL